MHNTSRSGFSMLELAIALVIIGLITGGVLVGRSMIRQQQVRDVVADVDRYTKAVKLFQDKYYALPGDMNNATDMWGADADCMVVQTTGHTTTCNGNGDGSIGRATAMGYADNPEWFRSWQQLANAGLIDGSYSGTGTIMVNTGVNPGLNIPKSSLSGSGFQLFQHGNTVGNVYWQSETTHVLLLGSVSGNNNVEGPLLEPVEAFALDQKLDDGKPSTGKIINYYRHLGYATPNCATTDVDATAEYKTTYTSPACSMLFKLGF